MHDRGMEAPKRISKNVITLGQNGPIISEECFSIPLIVEPRITSQLQAMFETVLLLTAENVMARDSVDSIGWTSEDEWNARKYGTVIRPGSVQQIATGFSNILSYWTESLSISGDKAITGFFDPTEPEIFIDHYSKSLEFALDVNSVLSLRFNLRRETIKRYFELAGEYVALRRDNTPEFFDKRLRLYRRLIELLEFAGAEKDLLFDKAEQETLWQTFVRGHDHPELRAERRKEEEAPGHV